MADDIPSIEDLISSSQGRPVDEDSPEGKFEKKQRDIMMKEMERLTNQKAAQAGIPYVNLFGFPISPDALSLIDIEDATRLKTVCFFYDGEKIRIATTEPENPGVGELLDELDRKYFCQGKIYLISERSLAYGLDLYRILPKLIPAFKGVEIGEEDLKKFDADIKDYRSLNEKINKVNISDVVTLVLATALKTGASDVHIEAEEEGIAVRLRIDGVLQNAAEIAKEKWKKIVSRMKLLAGVKINIADKPQDGRYTILLSKEKVEVRTSFLPTSNGESVVMRLLRSGEIKVPFDHLGIPFSAFQVLEREIKKPNGLILTTGPTGSGKTTTLYAILNVLNKPGTKIVTLEDPIEYKLEGISQSQVNEKNKYTFSTGLRSILRQDPDIVMVGEIRDLETAEIAVQASLTGHLVLSTLHTNDAAGVIPRLIDIGIKPYFLMPSINAVIGQRLVRKLCDHCKIKHELDVSERERVKKILAVISPRAGVSIPNKFPTLYKPGPGCKECKGISYKGRIGIFEIFTMTDDIKQLTLDNQPAFKILQQAIENGMITMLQDGILKCLSGVTSLEEIYRVIGKFDYVDALYDIVISQTIGRGIEITDEEMGWGEEAAKNLSDINARINDVPNRQMIAVIMAAGIKSSAGDIHIEPTEAGVKIRFRIDGILHEVAALPEEYHLQLISKVKVLAGFPTNVKRATWDGRFSIQLGSKTREKLDCRVSIISGGYGETVVIRLLTSQASALKMDDLGMRPYALKPVLRSMGKTKGIIITTGPTGSGKTTTLYSILNHLNNPDIKVITVEDPIEYHMEGIMQTQVDVEKGYSFAAALKSLLRQNPNVIMIGEIRDEETARIAIESAMTGHLVLSTIHANSAAGAFPRFVGLGIDRQMLANSVECSIGQRLARRICQNCKEKIDLAPDALKEVKSVLDSISPVTGVKIPSVFKFYKGRGCEQCGGIGYKGRIGLYEIIEMTPEMQKLVQGREVTDYEIEQTALKSGAMLMVQDGILKALEGETTVEEVFRVAR